MRETLSRLPRRIVWAGLATVLMVLVAFAARPTAAVAKSTVLSTPPFAAAPGSGLLCEVVNVSTITHSISMDLIGIDGTLIGHMPASGGSASVPSGTGIDGGVVNPATTIIGYCKITVDGTSADVRGEVVVNDATSGQTIAAAPAY